MRHVSHVYKVEEVAIAIAIAIAIAAPKSFVAHTYT
jgi:hypothetical protein